MERRRTKSESRWGRTVTRTALAGALAIGLAACSGNGEEGGNAAAEASSPAASANTGLGTASPNASPSTHKGPRVTPTPSASRSHNVGKSPRTASSHSPSRTGRAVLTFDAIAPPLIVEVYPGVSDSAADKTHNGTYNDGESVGAICDKKGREVTFIDPSGDHTKDRTSNDWIRIQGTPGETQYASAVYTANSAQLLPQLDACRN